jgi:hypothetical protein
MFRRLTKLTASFISISALLISSASFLAVSAPQNAEACRDCPFPMHLSNGHWLMPSGMSELLVEEINLGGGKVQTVVKLFDSLNGDLLAIGHLDHNKGRKRLKVELTDLAGGKMEADLTWANASRTKIKVKITCNQCNIQSSYWE